MSCLASSSNLFQTVFAIATEKKKPFEVLTNEQKQNVWLVETLQEQFILFYPSTAYKIFQVFIKHLPYAITLEDAYAIVYDAENELSYLRIIAQRKLEHSIYFASLEEAQHYTEKLNRCRQAYAKAKREPENKQDLVQCKKELVEIQEELKKLKRSPHGKLHASQYTDHPNLLIRKKALKEKTLLEKYQKVVHAKLIEAWKIDETNQELLENIIGPINFLFSHYGIVPCATRTDFPFSIIPILQGTCVYEKMPHFQFDSLHKNFNHTEKTAWNLENKIRKKFINHLNLKQHLPSQLIPSPIIEENVSLPEKEFKKQSFSMNFIHQKYAFSSLKIYQCLQDVLAEKEDFNKLIENFIITLKSLQIDDLDQKNWITELEELKEQKKAIYFENLEQATQYFINHPDGQDFKKHQTFIWSQHYASQHTHSPHLKIQQLALKAKKILKNYKEDISLLLKKNGANMQRIDLLEHLIGPKNYLFAYYGMVQSYRFSWIHVPVLMQTYETRQKAHQFIGSFNYTLENLSPKALEQEIRTDILKIYDNDDDDPDLAYLAYYRKNFPRALIEEELT